MKLLLKQLIFACNLLVFVGTAALAGQPQKSPDSSKPIKANIGEEFVIILESNATTGYQWQLARPLDRNRLALLRSEYIPDSSGVIGAGGGEEWFFEAMGAGEATISFKYVRPREKDAQPAKEKIFTVIIKEAAYDDSEAVQVISIEGNPKIMKKDGARWGGCTKEMLIDDGDRVKTGKGESVEISFAADYSKVIRIEESSDVLIVRGRSPYSIELLNGEVLSVIKKLPPKSSFEVKTPTAISGVRGTEWRTTTDGEKTAFSVFDETIYTKGIDVSGKLMAKETIVKKGWKIEVPKFKQPSPPIKLSEKEVARWNSWKKGLEKKIREREIRKPEIQKKIKELKALKEPKATAGRRQLQKEKSSKMDSLGLRDKQAKSKLKEALYQKSPTGTQPTFRKDKSATKATSALTGLKASTSPAILKKPEIQKKPKTQKVTK